MMVRDPLDNGRTMDIQFPAPEVPPTTEFIPTVDLKKIEEAIRVLQGRSFSGRNPHLGKMINCQVCGRRHREVNFAIREDRAEDGRKIKRLIYFNQCKQTFTYKVKNKDGVLMEVLREDASGALVPDYRTAIDPDLKPTVRQLRGRTPRPTQFCGPRRNPHFGKRNLQLVERTRQVFAEMGFTIMPDPNDKKQKPEIREQAYKNMEIARKAAKRQLRREAAARRRKVRLQTKLSRKLNRGTR